MKKFIAILIFLVIIFIKSSSQAFQNYGKLSNIEVDANNQYFCSIDGVLYSKDKTELVFVPSALIDGTFKIPGHVTKIGSHAFSSSGKLTTIVIPDSITTIGDWAFYDCNSLVSVYIGKNVNVIEHDAFFSCDLLKEIVIPASVTSIGSDAFWCNNLQTVYFEGHAPVIASDAFYNTKLTAYYPTNDATWTSSVRQNYGGSITWKSYTVIES